MAQEHSFSCVIHDKLLNDRFSAEVTVRKLRPVRRSRGDGTRIELADAFIKPISGQHLYYENKETWDRKAPIFNVPTREKKGSHNHFVLFDFYGNGLYIVRNPTRREVHRRDCSAWDLGQPFAEGLMKALREFS